jgi:RND family efflux transporter MFP subunit
LLLLPAAISPSTAADAPPPSLHFTGIIEPNRDAVLTAPVEGIIHAIHFQAGDTVPEGAVLLELDKRLEEIELRRRTIVAQQLEEELVRTRELFERTKSVSREQLREKESAHQIARAELELAQEQLNRRLVRAPFSGRVADLFELDPGEGCQVQTPLVRLVDATICRLVVNVPPRQAADLEPGDPLTIIVGRSDGARELPGRVSFVSPVVDPASGLLKLKVEFDNTKERVFPGITATLRLPDLRDGN